jgi:hypothetical protein
MSQESTNSPINIYQHLAIVLDQIASVCWQKLGLQPDIMTGRIEPDLAQAKVAVDVAGYLAGIVEAQLDEDDRRQVQRLVHDLRLNYVQKSREAGT